MATQQRPLELCRDLEIVKQSVEESSTPQPGTQCAETNTLDDVATASADGSTSTAKEDGVKSRYTRAKHYRDDFIQPEEEISTSSTPPSSPQVQCKAQRGTQRQAAASATTANRLLLQDELHTLI